MWKLDRWGRSVAHCVRSIQELVSLGVRFLSPTESIDTDAESPMWRFLLHLFAAFAEMEREIIWCAFGLASVTLRPREPDWGARSAYSGATRRNGGWKGQAGGP